MTTKGTRDRWTTHEADMFVTLAGAFDGLAQMARTIATTMDENGRKRITVENWSSTREGVKAAQKFLVGALGRAGDSAIPDVATAIDEISRRVAKSKAAKQPKHAPVGTL